MSEPATSRDTGQAHPHDDAQTRYDDLGLDSPHLTTPPSERGGRRARPPSATPHPPRAPAPAPVWLLASSAGSDRPARCPTPQGAAGEPAQRRSAGDAAHRPTWPLLRSSGDPLLVDLRPGAADDTTAACPQAHGALGERLLLSRRLRGARRPDRAY